MTGERLVRKAGAGRLHRFYEIEDGTHVDSVYATYPGRLRPILPCATRALDRMVAWVEDDRTPPPGGFVERPRRDDLRTGCSLRQ